MKLPLTGYVITQRFGEHRLDGIHTAANQDYRLTFRTRVL